MADTTKEFTPDQESYARASQHIYWVKDRKAELYGPVASVTTLILAVGLVLSGSYILEEDKCISDSEGSKIQTAIFSLAVVVLALWVIDFVFAYWWPHVNVNDISLSTHRRTRHMSVGFHPYYRWSARWWYRFVLFVTWASLITIFFLKFLHAGYSKGDCPAIPQAWQPYEVALYIFWFVPNLCFVFYVHIVHGHYGYRRHHHNGKGHYIELPDDDAAVNELGPELSLDAPYDGYY